MATVTRASGIEMEVDDDVRVPALARPAPSRAAPGAAERREDAVLVASLQALDVDLVDAIPLDVAPAAVSRAGPRPQGAPVARIKVPVQPDERVVVLLDDEGEYRWIVAEEGEVPATRTRGSAVRGGARTATVSLALSVPSGAPPQGSRGRGVIGGRIVRGAIAYVLRFVVKGALGLLVKRLEANLTEGLVRIDSADPATWKPVEPGEVRIGAAAGRVPRLLLLVHGTFSSTAGSFGALGGTEEGRAFLAAAVSHYDAVLGFDHRTLSVEPETNADAMLRALRAIRWPGEPVIDVVAFSRGGLVARTFIEMLLPVSGWKAKPGPAVFVGCTNSGTQLANPDKWTRFADHYTTIALGALRLGGLALGAAPWSVVAAGAIRGVGVLVKTLASVALEDAAIPGLAAMQPQGPVVTALNRTQNGQVTAEEARWFAVTSDFEPEIAIGKGSAQELPRKLLRALAVRGADAFVDALYGEPNDMVVHVRSMTLVDGGSSAFFRGTCDFATNGEVYHTNYFAQPRTARSLATWLVGDRARLPAAGRGRGAAVRGRALPGAPPAVAVSREAVAVRAGLTGTAQRIDALLASGGSVGSTAAPTRSPRPARKPAVKRTVRRKAKAKAGAGARRKPRARPGATRAKAPKRRTTQARRAGGARRATRRGSR